MPKYSQKYCKSGVGPVFANPHVFENTLKILRRYCRKILQKKRRETPYCYIPYHLTSEFRLYLRLLSPTIRLYFRPFDFRSDLLSFSFLLSRSKPFMPNPDLSPYVLDLFSCALFLTPPDSDLSPIVLPFQNPVLSLFV